MKQKNETAALWLHLFVGLGAVGGGLAAITDPLTPMGMDAATALAFSPFRTFLIPGLFLFAVLGGGNLLLAAMLSRKGGVWLYGSAAAGIVLMLWLVIQCAMLRAVHPLHVIFFVIGAAQLYLPFDRNRRAGQKENHAKKA